MDSKKEIIKNSNIDGDLAGGSSGILLILISQNVPSDSIWHSILLYASPFFGIAISAFWKWAKVEIDEYLNDRKFKKYIKDCILFIQNSLLDSNISELRKNELKKQYDLINSLATDVHIGKIKSINFPNKYENIASIFESIENEKKQLASGQSE